MKTAITIWAVALITGVLSVAYIHNEIDSATPPKVATISDNSATTATDVIAETQHNSAPVLLATYQNQYSGDYNSLTDTLQTASGTNVYQNPNYNVQ